MREEEIVASIKERAVNIFSEEGLLKRLKSGKQLRIKLGADPSRPDLHIGHSVPLRVLKSFQDMGHKRLALEAGEDPKNNPIEYILECIKTIYSVNHKNEITSENINVTYGESYEVEFDAISNIENAEIKYYKALLKQWYVKLILHAVIIINC